jgi:chromatin segregation and condensation protein Rec8/ScpA/Scc1 (kleisin family)
VIRRQTGTGGDGEELRHFLPEEPARDVAPNPSERSLRLSSAWATTFSASLELAKQGDVGLLQEQAFRVIHLSRLTAEPSA